MNCGVRTLGGEGCEKGGGEGEGGAGVVEGGT